ncbi:hypothetical protein ACM66B_003737 [Microbotryomycetes sp. NB124-2]
MSTLLDFGPVATNQQAVVILGPILIGCCFHLVLYGLLLGTFFKFTQTSAWKDDGQDDHGASLPHGSSNSGFRRRCGLTVLSRREWTKAIVCFVMLLATASVGMQTYDIFYFGVLQSRSVFSLVRGTVTELVEPVVAGVTGAIVESVLLARCVDIVKRRWLRRVVVCGCAVVIFTGLMASIGATVWLSRLYLSPLTFITIAPSFNNVCAIWMVTTASVDVCISVIYIIGLRARLAWLNNETKDSAIRMITRICVQSASYTAIVASAGAIIFLLNNTPSFALVDAGWAFFLPLPSLYALSLFTTLDMRNQVSSYLARQRQEQQKRDLASSIRMSSNIRQSQVSQERSVIGLRRPLSVRLRDSAGRLRARIDEEDELEEKLKPVVKQTRGQLHGVVVNVEFYTTSETRRSEEDLV